MPSLTLLSLSLLYIFATFTLSFTLPKAPCYLHYPLPPSFPSEFIPSSPAFFVFTPSSVCPLYLLFSLLACLPKLFLPLLCLTTYSHLCLFPSSPRSPLSPVCLPSLLSLSLPCCQVLTHQRQAANTHTHTHTLISKEYSMQAACCTYCTHILTHTRHTRHWWGPRIQETS